ncbi:MAG: hypothetical protein E6848_26130 [Bradyrhizobium sp.]|nr:hypothetical protein [Bradyrhizobium sp.]
MTIRIIGKRHVGRRSGRTVGARERRLARDHRAVGERLRLGVRRQVDRGDAELAQRLQRRRAVSIGDEHLELVPAGIAGIELAVVVGIEDVGKRLHVGRRRRIPARELERLGIVDRAVARRVIHQHAIARPGPRRAMLQPVANDVHERVGLIELGNVDAVAVQVEHDGGRRHQIIVDIIRTVFDGHLTRVPLCDRNLRHLVCRTAGTPVYGQETEILDEIKVNRAANIIAERR